MKLSKLKTLLIGSASMLAVLSLTLVSCSEQTGPNPIPDPTPPKPVPVPPNISEFQKGGEIIYNSTKKLSVNKYLSVVQKLDFREYTNIGDLTDSILNEKLTKDPSFSNLTLSILDDSSQTTGKLLLSLNGKYENLEIKNPTTIEEFGKSNIEVVEILTVEKIEGADKLLKFKVQTGKEVRQIVSGIAKSYPEFEELKGKKVLAVLNLPPVKLRGVISQGMLLSTEDKKNGIRLVEITSNIKIGAKLK